mgnify:CR=1 FL=1
MLAFWCWLALLAVVIAAVTTNHFRGSRHHGRRENANVGNGFIPPEESEEEPPTAEAETTTTPQSQSQSQQGTCDATGYSRFPYLGRDSAERLLLREGVIDSLPNSRCDNPERRKNVFLVVGDGMGWEMARAGAIARRVLDELKSLGCDTKVGCPNNTAAKEAFVGRTLDSYYTEGKGSGLSFQELENFALVTTSAIVAQSPNPGNYTAPLQSLLEGLVTDHETGMAPLATNECGYPVDFNPLDHATHGGNMVLWDNTKGGKYPWDERYYTPTEAADRSDGFDPTHIMQHAVDSAATATTLSTGQKVGNHMLAFNLYDE